MLTKQVQTQVFSSLNRDGSRLVLLPVDPYCIYAYWELPHDIKNLFIDCFGNEIWEKSIPVLKVINLTKNKSIYLEIDDSSDNRFINVPDSNCTYMAELGRIKSGHFFINTLSSNCVSVPNSTISDIGVPYFVNYEMIKNEGLKLKSEKIYNIINRMQKTMGMHGLSSPELLFPDKAENPHPADSTGSTHADNSKESTHAGFQKNMPGTWERMV